MPRCGGVSERRRSLTLEEAKAISDPILRAQAAVALMKEAQALLGAAEDLRNLAFNQLRHTDGMSLREIAGQFGVSKTLVATVTG